MALRGLKVIEMAGLAPIPYCGQILKDYGANVIRIDRAGTQDFGIIPQGQRLYLGSSFNLDQQSRGKHSVAVNMKSPGGQQVIQDLSAKSDVILDPFRPGVMERLGCGPGRFIRKKGRY